MIRCRLTFSAGWAGTINALKINPHHASIQNKDRGRIGLAWRCDLSMTTAREKVRVAHALKTLPAIADAFSTGELSYAKVRALTRVADRDNESALLKFALRTTAANVADRCRELRLGSEASSDTTARAYANRSLRIRRDWPVCYCSINARVRGCHHVYPAQHRSCWKLHSGNRVDARACAGRHVPDDA